MPELTFQVTGAEAAARGLTPLLNFKLQITAPTESTVVHGVLLNAQIQIQCPQRAYSTSEKEKLVELFGTPEQWGQTLRNRLWTQANTGLGAFTGRTETMLPVQCTYDLNIASTKYLYGLEGGEIGLLFLFNGSVFYATPEGGLQVEPISWNSECTYRMPVQLWRELMEQTYPNSAWLALQREVFDRLCAFKRRNSLVTWEETIEELLPPEVEAATGPAQATQREEAVV
jgi:hypothetical protein